MTPQKVGEILFKNDNDLFQGEEGFRYGAADGVKARVRHRKGRMVEREREREL